MENNIFGIGQDAINIIAGIMIVSRVAVGITKTKKDDKVFAMIVKPIKSLLGIKID